MAFVVEDGTGLADANSYGAVAGADTYFAERGVTAWAGTNDVKQQNLVKATDYIEARWSNAFRGYQLYPDVQALSFPRTVFDPLPVWLVRATYEYALRAQLAPLAPDPTVDASGRTVKRTKKKVGPLEKEFEFATDGPASSLALFKPYPIADAMIAKLLNNSRRVIR